MSCASLGLTAPVVKEILNVVSGSSTPFVITAYDGDTIVPVGDPLEPTIFDIIPETLSTGLIQIEASVQGTPITGGSQYNLNINLINSVGTVVNSATSRFYYVADPGDGGKYTFMLNATLIIPQEDITVGITFVPELAPYTDFTCDFITASYSIIQFTSVQ